MEKSEWTPSNDIEWLGFLIDLSKGEFAIPENKIQALKCRLLEIQNTKHVQAKYLASVIGKINSMSLGLDPVSRLMTRSMYVTLNSRLAWYQKVEISAEASEEVGFWLNRLEIFNGQDIWPKPSAVRMVYSDASTTGYGGYTVEHGNLVANGQWSSEEAAQSSTWRELRVVRMVLESFKDKLANERIRWFTDNQNVVRIVQHGSPKPLLQTEALSIFFTCVDSHIRIEPEWIPREENELADYYSRVVDYDDWMLNPTVFQWLDGL